MATADGSVVLFSDAGGLESVAGAGRVSHSAVGHVQTDCRPWLLEEAKHLLERLLVAVAEIEVGHSASSRAKQQGRNRVDMEP